MNYANQVVKFYTKNKRKVDAHIQLLGAYLTLHFLIRRANAIIQSLSAKQVDIANRYGKGTYALITGGASGIGKEFALDLARKGFNLILIDFNQINLESAQQDIQKIKSDLLVKTILLDFSKGTNPDFYRKLQNEISSLDISIVINNVGTQIGAFGLFENFTTKHILDSFYVNYVPSIMVTQCVINQMLLRNKYQSLILNISSGGGMRVLPYFFGYGAAKNATANFFEALSLELRDHKNIDILNIQPLYVRTALIDFRKGFFIIEPAQLIQDTWKYVGKTTTISPNWKHQTQLYFTNLIPNWIYNCVQQKIYYPFAKVATQKIVNQE